MIEKTIKFFKWVCRRDKPIQITLLTKEFTWPSAGADACTICNVRREFHEHQDHIFKEV